MSTTKLSYLRCSERMRQTLAIPSLESTDEFVRVMLDLFDQHQVFCFHGDLGAGKTTYIKLLCDALGVEDAMSSPSFAIVNEYETESKRICHFDLYRLKTPDELLDIGWEDYLETADLLLIEWPEQGGSYIPDDAFHIYITYDLHSESRQLTLTDQLLTHV